MSPLTKALIGIAAWLVLLAIFVYLWHRSGYWREKEFDSEQQPKRIDGAAECPDQLRGILEPDDVCCDEPSCGPCNGEGRPS